MKNKTTSCLFLFYCINILICLIVMSCSSNNNETGASVHFKKISSQQSGITFINAVDENYDKNYFDKFAYVYNGGGVAVGDVNNDGLQDIYFTANSHSGNKLYLNKGNFKFEDITAKAGVAGTSDWCTGVTMADVNGDGFLDIYVSAVNIEGKLKSRNELFINNGNGTF